MKRYAILFSVLITAMSIIHSPLLEASPTIEPSIDTFIMLLREKIGADAALSVLDNDDPKQILTALKQIDKVPSEVIETFITKLKIRKENRDDWIWRSYWLSGVTGTLVGSIGVFLMMYNACAQ